MVMGMFTRETSLLANRLRWQTAVQTAHDRVWAERYEEAAARREEEAATGGTMTSFLAGKTWPAPRKGMR
jgi:hypothetical protein